MSQQNNGFFPYSFISGTAHHIPSEPQIDVPIFPGQFEPHRSVSDTPAILNRSTYGQSQLQRFPIHRSVHGLMNQSQQPCPEQASQHRSIPERSNQYSYQQFQNQYPGPSDLRPVQPVQTSFPIGTMRRPVQNQQGHLQPSGSVMSRRGLLTPPPYVARQLPSHGFLQNGIQQTGSHLPAQASPLPTPSPQRSESPQSDQNSSPREFNANQQNTYQRQRPAPIQRSIQIPRPSSRDWTDYRINKEGTRLPKTTPPPQGTYKVNEGIGKTDYSDPRDFFAPTKEEQEQVWNALTPTREAFEDLTLIDLAIHDMRCLSMGYNASWQEIKRKFVEWIFENFSPDRTAAGKTTMTAQTPSSEMPGYSRQVLQTTVKQQHNPKEIKFFANGELVVNVEELLPKLERWYGLIEDHEYSPTWPYERERNAGGYLIQNRDCFACMHCRSNQIFCYGFRENIDRKCMPCEKQNLPCSIEEGSFENKRA